MNNSPAYNNLSNIITSLIRKLKLILIIKLIFKFKIFYLLHILLFNSNSKTIYNYIYLSLLINQLQYLIIKKKITILLKIKKKYILNLISN